MRENEAILGDDSCPCGVAPATDEQAFFGSPVRCDGLASISSLTMSVLASLFPLGLTDLASPAPRQCARGGDQP